jgi:hypothetical protein
VSRRLNLRAGVNGMPGTLPILTKAAMIHLDDAQLRRFFWICYRPIFGMGE